MTNFFIGIIQGISQAVKKNSFLGFGFFLTAAQIVGGVFGYGYQILMGRMLLPEDFALFSALMASFVFLSAPMIAVSMLIARRVSGFKAHHSLFLVKSFFLHVNKLLFIFSGLILLFFWVFAIQLQEYLHLPNAITLILFEAVLIVGIFNTLIHSFFQGLQKFIYIGAFGLLSVILKIILSIGFILANFDLIGALLGVFFSTVIVFVTGAVILLKQLPSQQVRSSFTFKLANLIQIYPVLIAAIATAAMTQLDMVLVNWYFPPREAGLYAAASVLGKTILYLPGGLIVVLFPMVSELHAKGGSGFKIFRQAVIATIICSGAISLIYWTYGDFIILIFYGPNYEGAGQILRWYGFAVMPMAIVIIAEQYLIAKGRVLFAWLFLIIAPFQILSIHLWHSELWMVLLIVGFFGSLLAFIGWWIQARSATLIN
jgi:O-antigen/teichoic acid export membrane protein